MFAHQPPILSCENTNVQHHAIVVQCCILFNELLLHDGSVLVCCFCLVNVVGYSVSVSAFCVVVFLFVLHYRKHCKTEPRPAYQLWRPGIPVSTLRQSPPAATHAAKIASPTCCAHGLKTPQLCATWPAVIAGRTQYLCKTPSTSAIRNTEGTHGDICMIIYMC